MEEIKKRGRKKKIPEELTKEEPVEIVKKKRGRKKKWENTQFKNNFFGETPDVIKFDNNNTSTIDESDYKTNKVKFGNLFIKIHDKEKKEFNFSKEDSVDKDCLLSLSSEEDEPTVKKTSIKKKTLNVYNKESCKSRCFNCHHFFETPPFYLPFDHCPVSDKYKIYGNFCSPNCVKTFSINSKHFNNKQYLIGQFYRKLFGANFRIKPAPSYLTLKDYGGHLTIEEYRQSFYNNSRYTLNNINCKIIKEEIIFSR